MNVATGFTCLGLLLALVAPALCGPQAALVGRWQSPTNARGMSHVLEFRTDGTETVSLWKGGKIVQYRSADGKLLTLRYAVSGNKLMTTYPNGYVDAERFKLQADTLTILPLRSEPHATTLTRLKD